MLPILDGSVGQFVVVKRLLPTQLAVCVVVGLVPDFLKVTKGSCNGNETGFDGQGFKRAYEVARWIGTGKGSTDDPHFGMPKSA